MQGQNRYQIRGCGEDFLRSNGRNRATGEGGPEPVQMGGTRPRAGPGSGSDVVFVAAGQIFRTVHAIFSTFSACRQPKTGRNRCLKDIQARER
jgi:hypothetical protein